MFVLTMFAVAFGSLSQVQAALASPRLPAPVASAAHAGQIYRHAQCDGPRPGGGRNAPNSAWRALSNGTKTRIPAPGQGSAATETPSAPKITSAAPLAAPRNAAQARQITSPAGTTFTAGQAGTFTVASTGSPTCALSETGALPAGVTFKDNKNGTATLAGTPAADTGGTYTLAITATNGVSPAATQAFTLTVYQACQITSHDHATFIVGQAGTFTVATTGVPNCGLFETGALPSGVTFTDNGNGTAAISGTPHAPAACTRSRSSPGTVSEVTPPRP